MSKQRGKKHSKQRAAKRREKYLQKQQQLNKQLPAVISNSKPYEKTPEYIEEALETLEQEFTGRWDDRFMFTDTFRNSGSPMHEFKNLFTELKKTEASVSNEFLDKTGTMKTFITSSKYEQFLENEQNIKDLIKAHKYDETLTTEEYKQVNAAYKIMRDLYDMRSFHRENQEYILKRREAEDKLLEYLWIKDIQEYGAEQVLNLKDYKDTIYNLASAVSAILNISSSSVLSEFKKSGLVAGFSKYAKQFFDKGREIGNASIINLAASQARATQSTIKIIMDAVHQLQKNRKDEEDITVSKTNTVKWDPWSDVPNPALYEAVSTSMYEGEYDNYDDFNI